MRRSLVIGIISGLLGAAGLAAGAPAKADCVRAEVVVLWSNGTEQTVWPQSQCIVETGVATVITHTTEDEKGGVPNGLPNGARVSVWVPVP